MLNLGDLGYFIQEKVDLKTMFKAYLGISF